MGADSDVDFNDRPNGVGLKQAAGHVKFRWERKNEFGVFGVKPRVDSFLIDLEFRFPTRWYRPRVGARAFREEV